MPFTRNARHVVADRNVALTDDQVLALSAYLDRSTAEYRDRTWRTTIHRLPASVGRRSPDCCRRGGRDHARASRSSSWLSQDSHTAQSSLSRLDNR